MRDPGFRRDISPYAIQNVQADIQPFVRIGSVTEPFPQRYDLIVSIEVLEHLPKQEAEKAVENLCQHTDDILFSSTPFDYKEATHFNVQPPEYWAECFARNGFFRDIDFDASFITPWAVRYRRIPARLEQVVANYERKYWSLIQENRGKARYSGIAQKVDLSRTMLELSQTKLEMDEIRSSESWQLLQQLIRFRLTAIPLGSRRETLIYMLVRASARFDEGVSGIFSRLRSRASWQARILLLQISYRLKPANVGVEIQVPETNERPPIEPHQETVDIIICVHDALNDVRRCLQSVAEFSSAPCSIIIVDDGSQTDTRDFLVAFAAPTLVELAAQRKSQGVYSWQPTRDCARAQPTSLLC